MVGRLSCALMGILTMCLVLIMDWEYTSAQEFQYATNLETIFLRQIGDVKQEIKRAEALFAKDRQLEAIKEYEKIVEKHPTNLKSWKRLAQLYTWNNMPDKAIACYEKIISLNPLDTETMKTLAQHYIWTDRQKQAINLYEKVLVFEPENLHIHKQLAQLYLWNEMSEKAIQEYEIIIKLDPTDTETMEKLAQNYFWTNRPAEGIKLLEKVLQLNPDNLKVRKELAQHYIWQEMPEKAIEQYEQIIKQDSTDVELMKKLAQQYMWSNKPAKAVPLYEKILKYEPANSQIRMQLAKAYLWSDQGDKAEKPLAQVLERVPGNKEAMLLLAELQRWSGKWDSAKTWLKKLLLLEPKNKKAKELLESIRKDYGTLTEARYYRISDSNQLTREEIPLKAYYYHNRHWECGVNVAHVQVKDGKLDSSLVGYEARLATKYNFSNRSSVLIEVAATTYSSSWIPITAKFQINQSFFDILYTNIKFHRAETREGVRALADQIVVHGWSAEFYLQATKRWSVSGLYSRFSYSDENVKITAITATNFTVFLKNPKIVVYGSYAFEDFEKIYSTSLPYWTPDQLTTASVGMNIDHTIGKWTTVGLGYALTNQQAIYAHNFNYRVTINFTKFDKLYFQYIKNGSDIYNAESIQAFYQHRF